MVAKRIRDLLSDRAAGFRVRRALIGLIYCSVQLEEGSSGVAFTFPAQRPAQPCGTGLPAQGALGGRRADQLIEYLGAEDLVSSALGMAACNAVIAASGSDPRAVGGDILDHLEIRKGERICMVGCFLLLPLAAGCREVAILGPSTPLLPEAFRDLPVHCLSGIRVDDADAVFRTIGEGGGFRLFKDHASKLNIRLTAA